MTIGDWMVPGWVFAFCAVITWLSLQMEKANPIIVGHAMQPRAYPIFLMALIAILGVILTVQVVRHGHYLRVQLPWQTYLTVALTWFFYLVATRVDMFLGLSIVMFLMCRVWGERRWWAALLLAIAVPLATFLIFDQVLEKRFPRGVLTNLYYD